jgi:hypothetical protein
MPVDLTEWRLQQGWLAKLSFDHRPKTAAYARAQRIVFALVQANKVDPTFKRRWYMFLYGGYSGS